MSEHTLVSTGLLFPPHSGPGEMMILLAGQDPPSADDDVIEPEFTNQLIN